MVIVNIVRIVEINFLFNDIIFMDELSAWWRPYRAWGGVAAFGPRPATWAMVWWPFRLCNAMLGVVHAIHIHPLNVVVIITSFMKYLYREYGARRWIVLHGGALAGLGLASRLSNPGLRPGLWCGRLSGCVMQC